MFHKAIDMKFKEGTVLEVTFQNGLIKTFDMSVLFHKYPNLKQLKDRGLFLSGRLVGFYGIVWNDELDIETETIYVDGTTTGRQKPEDALIAAGAAVSAARAKAGLSQIELSSETGIDQSDISKIERGVSNPTVETLGRIATALGGELVIRIE